MKNIPLHVDYCGSPDPHNKRYDVEIVGKYLRLRFHGQIKPRRSVWKRNPIAAFTRRSRFRMLCGLSKIVWDRVGISRFITLTYPDECVHYDSYKRNLERWRFWRSLETWAGDLLGGCWRVEWKKRLTGALQGIVAPHIHCMVFADIKLGTNTLSGLWQAAIESPSFPIVHSTRVEAADGVACYVAKYCGKVDDSSLLECVSYLSSLGRHYGWFRDRCIPWAPRHMYYEIPHSIATWLNKVGRKKMPWLDLLDQCGWTMIGDNAEVLGEHFARILEIALDGGAHPPVHSN